MQKPPSDELKVIVKEFANEYLTAAPEELRNRIEFQVFRMFDDLSEEEWAKQPDVELRRVAAMMASQVIDFLLMARRIGEIMSSIGMEVPEDWGMLPSEMYPDRNFYEVVDEVITQGRAEFGESSVNDLSGLDFSGRFNA